VPGHSTRRRGSRQSARRASRPGEAETFKLLGHPLRQRILTALNKRVASPKELADELGEDLGRLSYHVKVLADADAIELVRTAKRRGATEHFYRGTRRPMLSEADWSRLPASAQNALGVQTFKQIHEHVVEAAAKAAFEDPQVHVSWTTIELDPEAHTTLMEELVGMVNRALELEAESANRRAAGEALESIQSELAILHFRRSGPGSDKLAS
jgi:DNA-binding transcriptional ArsR family regulator